MIIIPQSATLPFTLCVFSLHSGLHTPFPWRVDTLSFPLSKYFSLCPFFAAGAPAFSASVPGQESHLLVSITHCSMVSGTSCSIFESSSPTVFNTVTFQACGELLGAA